MSENFEYGITRRGVFFREIPPMEHEMSMFRSTCMRTTPVKTDDVASSVGADGYSQQLGQLIDFLKTQDGLKMYKTAFRVNMLYKVERYSQLQKKAEEDVEKEIQVIQITTPELKRLARVQGDQDNWQIFESISERYKESKNRAASFEAIKMRAQHRLQGSMTSANVVEGDAVLGLRDDLVRALQSLINFTSQTHVVAKTVDIVSSFIKHPKLFRTKLMNFMLVGGAGTGKTSIASAIGDVFAKAGIFVGNKLVEAGRAELIGQYEGQTVARTRHFLVSNLDSGVILVDEAYAITPWQNGKPESYGSESVTAMVEFMTRYPGLYCIIVAGYETQMVRYFLPTNEGLSRRFPNKYVLRDMSPRELLHIFKRSLLKAQDLYVSDGSAAHIKSHDYFDDDAWNYLERLMAVCLDGVVIYTDEFDTATLKKYQNVRTFRPNWGLMYTIFENQAGSMTTLADEAITILTGKITYRQVMDTRENDTCLATMSRQSRSVMRHVIVQTIMKSSLSHYPRYIEELEQIERLIQV